MKLRKTNITYNMVSAKADLANDFVLRITNINEFDFNCYTTDWIR